jgi:leucyl-tRNA synthetase
MAKEYNHLKIEKKWQKEWARKKAFKTEDFSKKKKFYVLDMFPYPSGEGLHVGHPKGYIATDIISRMKRMQGFNVLHPIGFDAFGLPAENYAIKTKTNPEIAVRKNVARYKNQLELIGLDYDWSREVNTTDPNFYKWTQWIFLKLLEKGLAYESDEPVNWCPFDKTILANEDVENGKCERCGTVVEKRPIRQWVLKITDYADRLLSDLDSLDWPESIKTSQKNWIGRSEGAEIDFPVWRSKESIKVFTTRPDTIFGATYMVLAPEHELIQKLLNQIENKDQVQAYINEVKTKTEIDRTNIEKEKTGVRIQGISAQNPANEEVIPIFIADYVLSTHGTGAIMAVPAHDERDLQFAKKHKLPIKDVIIPYLIDKHDPPIFGKRTVKKTVAQCVVHNSPEDKILVLKWEKFSWISFVSGGVEEGENPKNTVLRELEEETGYIDVKTIEKIGDNFFTTYHATHKDENRVAEVITFKVVLKSERKSVTRKNENEKFVPAWVTKEEARRIVNQVEAERIWQMLDGKTDLYIGDGILANSKNFDGMQSETAKKEITKFVKGKWVTKYKLRDWVFSRQRYWGEPIPVIYEKEKEISDDKFIISKNRKAVPLAGKDLPLKLPKVKSYEPTGEAESPLAKISSWVNVKKSGKMYRRESNTMPQWAGSSWYYLRYMDPKNKKSLVDRKKEKYWNMIDLYVGGAEHATRHLIYARFWHKFLYDIGVVKTKEPFKKLQNVGLIIANDGRKMSKRFGNVINPDSIVKDYGADTLRMYEMFMGPFDQSVAWSEDNIFGVRRFIERVWRMQDKVKRDSNPRIRTNDTNKNTSKKDREKFEILLNKTVRKVSEDIESMSFNTAVSAMMILINEIEGLDQVGRADFEVFLKILSPFAPHITEEIWHNLGNKTLLVKEKWPKWNPKKLVENEVIVAVQINSKVRAEITLPYNATEGEAVRIARLESNVEKWLLGKEVKKVVYVKNRILNFVI